MIAIKWSYPTWVKLYHNMSDDEILGIDKSTLKSWAEEIEKCRKENREKLQPKVKDLVQIRALVEKLYGKKSNEYKYTANKMKLPSCPINYSWRINDIKKKQKDIKTKKRQEKQAKEETSLAIRAAAFLMEHGKKLGVDFEADTAIGEADSLKYDILVKEAKDQDGFQSFDGDDYCEGCLGWDGDSRRCDCGNRRVSWGWNGNFENMYIYGEAY